MLKIEIVKVKVGDTKGMDGKNGKGRRMETDVFFFVVTGKREVGN